MTGAHLHPQLGVQVGEGLVEQQHVRLDAQGAGQGHTLLLAAGQALGQTVGILVHMHQLHELVRLLARSSPWAACVFFRPNSTFFRTVIWGKMA